MTLAELREALNVAMARMVAANESIEKASPDDDLDALTRAFDDAEAEVRSLKQRITRAESCDTASADIKASEARAAAVVQSETRAAVTSVSVTRDEHTYRPDGQHVFLRDVLNAHDSSARERLERNAAQSSYQRAQSITGTNVGSQFVVPELYLGSDYARVRDAGRPFANAVGPRPLPSGIDQIRVPRVTAGVTAANQTEGSAFSTGDVTTGDVTADVETIGHYNDLSRQVIERSDPTMEQILIEDQFRAVNLQLDSQLISGTGTSPQVRGIRNVSGIATSAYTDASPTVAEFLTALGKAFAVHTANFQQVEAVVLHPRRWSWVLGGLDGSNRPLVVPTTYVPQGQNIAGTSVAAGAPRGPVGTILGVPVIVDGNIPITVGASTTEDVVEVLTLSDIRLWESPPMVAVLPEVVAHQGQVRVVTQVDFAFMAGRYPKAITEVSGTGLVIPA